MNKVCIQYINKETKEESAVYDIVHAAHIPSVGELINVQLFHHFAKSFECAGVVDSIVRRVYDDYELVSVNILVSINTKV